MYLGKGLEALTARERESLHAFFSHGHRGAAAKHLGISENTLKSHLGSARRKTAMSDQQLVELLFPDHSGPHPKRVSPQRVMEDAPEQPPMLDHPADTPLVTAMAEDKPALPRKSPFKGGRNDLSLTMRLLVIAAMMLAITATYVLTFAMLDGVQRVADQVNPLSQQ